MKLLKVPDIQDIGDVNRFAIHAWYPLRRQADGSVTAVIKVVGATHSRVLVHKYAGDDGATDEMTLDAFLQLEQGYYKSRLVEYEGSVIYLQNTGADERIRCHSFRLEAIDVWHNHEDVTHKFGSIPAHKRAMVGLSIKRTQVKDAIAQLEEGTIIGCALSDNFGLITSENSDAIQIVRRNKVIGEVHNGEPYLKAGFDHYFYAVNKLWH